MRLGFERATGDVLVILDADLTVAPEDLAKFYDALVRGTTDLANGSRLVYDLEPGAMQFLNVLANKAFSLVFSYLIGQKMKDTLCGTKALLGRDYESIARQRSYFGDLDPFGDFDLILGGARLGLKIVDVPVRYSARSYGRTNISRFRHGWLLLQHGRGGIHEVQAPAGPGLTGRLARSRARHRIRGEGERQRTREMRLTFDLERRVAASGGEDLGVTGRVDSPRVVAGETEEGVCNRVPHGEAEHGYPAPLEHAAELVERGGEILEVLQHAQADECVELSIRKRNVVERAVAQVGFDTEAPKGLADALLLGMEIDRGETPRTACELRQEDA